MKTDRQIILAAAHEMCCGMPGIKSDVLATFCRLLTARNGERVSVEKTIGALDELKEDIEVLKRELRKTKEDYKNEAQ